ncbi:MAG: hypothetical protein ABSH09_34835 [Bryobacteraceae bacterium]|jgi:hypothetical protein
MTHRRFLLLLLCAGLPQLAAAADLKAAVEAQRPSIASPILGYMISEGQLVAIEGINGAAHTRAISGSRGTGDRLILPPGQNYRWVERGGLVYVSSIIEGNPRAISGAWTGADLVAFNSDGSAAMLYRSTGRLQIITGLPGTPTVAREIDGPAEATAAALSDDANTLLLATAQGVHAASANDPWRFVLAGPVHAIALIPGGSDALVAAKDQTYFLKSSMTTELLTNDSARAIASSADGRLGVFLASSGTEAIVVDLRTRTTKRLQLGAAAEDIQRGRGSAILFVPREGASPWLFDSTSGALSFAPALPETARGR